MGDVINSTVPPVTADPSSSEIVPSTTSSEPPTTSSTPTSSITSSDTTTAPTSSSWTSSSTSDSTSSTEPTTSPTQPFSNSEEPQPSPTTIHISTDDNTPLDPKSATFEGTSPVRPPDTPSTAPPEPSHSPDTAPPAPPSEQPALIPSSQAHPLQATKAPPSQAQSTWNRVTSVATVTRTNAAGSTVVVTETIVGSALAAQPTTPNKSSSNVAAIAGGVAGGIGALIIGAVLLWWCVRRRRKKNAISPDFFDPPSPSRVDGGKFTIDDEHISPYSVPVIGNPQFHGSQTSLNRGPMSGVSALPVSHQYNGHSTINSDPRYSATSSDYLVRSSAGVWSPAQAKQAEAANGTHSSFYSSGSEPNYTVQGPHHNLREASHSIPESGYTDSPELRYAGERGYNHCSVHHAQPGHGVEYSYTLDAPYASAEKSPANTRTLGFPAPTSEGGSSSSGGIPSPKSNPLNSPLQLHTPQQGAATKAAEAGGFYVAQRLATSPYEDKDPLLPSRSHTLKDPSGDSRRNSPEACWGSRDNDSTTSLHRLSQAMPTSPPVSPTHESPTSPRPISPLSPGQPGGVFQHRDMMSTDPREGDLMDEIPPQYSSIPHVSRPDVA